MFFHLKKQVLNWKRYISHFLKRFFSVLRDYFLWILSFFMILLSILCGISYVQYKKMIELEKKVIQQKQFIEFLQAKIMTFPQAQGETKRLLKMVTEKYLLCIKKNSILILLNQEADRVIDLFRINIGAYGPVNEPNSEHLSPTSLNETPGTVNVEISEP